MEFGEEQVIGQESLITVAAIQFEPQLGQVTQNREKLLELVGSAFVKKAQLIVTPECSNGGYVFNSRSEAYACAESATDGPTVSALERLLAKGTVISSPASSKRMVIRSITQPFWSVRRDSSVNTARPIYGMWITACMNRATWGFRYSISPLAGSG